MDVENLLGSASETAVVYRYLDLLAGRTASLQRRADMEELRRLRQENQILREELSRSRKPALKDLLVFLPLLYRSFWSTVPAHELALLARSLDVPQIPSPYPEPGPEALSRLRREFLSLSQDDQRTIVRFAKTLPYALKVRPEMRSLVEKADEN